MRFFVFADWGFKGYRLLRDLLCFADGIDRHVHAFGDFFGGRLAAKFLHQLRAGAHLFVDSFNHVHRNANGAGLIGDRASDSLPNPPGRVSGKFIAATPLEFVGSTHQSDVAFLNQIQELQAAVGIFFRNGNHEAKIGFGQFFFGLFGVSFAAKNNRQGAFEIGGRGFAGLFDFADLYAGQAQFFAGFGGSFTARRIGTAFEPNAFALQTLKAFHRMTNQIDQALAFAFLEMNRAH